MEQCDLTGAKLRAAAPGLSRLASLRQLEMTYRDLNAQDWGVLAQQVFPSYGCLETLDLQACHLTAAKLRAAAPGLGRLRALRALALGGNPGLDPEGWGVLAREVLPSLLHLESLDLSRCGLAAERLRAAAPGLRRLEALRHLALACNEGIDAEGWAILARQVFPFYTRLESLEVHSCNLTTAKIRAAAPGFGRLIALQRLDMWDNHGLDADGWHILAWEALAPASARLQRLDLSHCGLAAAALGDAAPALAGLGALRELALAGLGGLAAEDWGLLAREVFPSYTLLESLTLAECGLTTAKLRAAAPGLARLAALRQLLMAANPDIDAEGWAALAREVLPHLPQLQKLDIRWCSPPDAAFFSLEREGLMVDFE